MHFNLWDFKHQREDRIFWTEWQQGSINIISSSVQFYVKGTSKYPRSYKIYAWLLVCFKHLHEIYVYTEKWQRQALPILIPPTAPHSLSSSIIWGWYNRPVVAAVPSGLSLTPHQETKTKKKKTRDAFVFLVLALLHEFIRVSSFIHQWFFRHFVGPWPIFQFPKLFTQSVGLLRRVISPSQGRYLHGTTETQNKRTQTSMSWVGFEPTTPAL
jgi:hypothetical protein